MMAAVSFAVFYCGIAALVIIPWSPVGFPVDRQVVVILAWLWRHIKAVSIIDYLELPFDGVD